MRGWGRGRYRQGGFAAGWEVAEAHHGVLFDVLNDVGLGSGWGALGEASVEGVFGAFVGEQKMLYDLLDAPAIEARKRTELRLGGVEALKGVGQVSLELL
jgi:hypothetical protein